MKQYFYDYEKVLLKTKNISTVPTRDSIKNKKIIVPTRDNKKKGK